MAQRDEEPWGQYHEMPAPRSLIDRLETLEGERDIIHAAINGLAELFGELAADVRRLETELANEKAAREAQGDALYDLAANG